MMILDFFQFLRKLHIDFCLINGYKEIIAKLNSSSDIDILLKQNDFENLEKIIHDFCSKYNYQIVQIIHHDIWSKNFFLFDPGSGKSFNLDLYAELSRKGIVYFREDDIFNTLQNYKNIPVLSNEKEFISYLIKKIDKNDLTKQNFAYLCSLYKNNENLCINLLSTFFPKYGSIVTQAFKNDDLKLIGENYHGITQDLCVRNSYSLKKNLLNLKRMIKEIIYPTGLTISFLGPDGSGKSTIINSIFENKLPFKRKDYFHLKPFPSSTIGSAVVEDPHSQKVYSTVKSYMKLLFFVYQYNTGWLKNIFKLKIKSSLIVFDRYYDDLLVDYRRYRYGGNGNIAKLIKFFIPKPDLYFILTSNPEVIYKRKQEVTFEELKRQIEKYKSLADGKRYFNIDVNRTPDEISKEIIEIMMDKMHERH